MNHQHRPAFHIELNSLEEFAAFCALIRDEAVDLARVKALAERLQAATKDLEAAEAADHQSPNPHK